MTFDVFTSRGQRLDILGYCRKILDTVKTAPQRAGDSSFVSVHRDTCVIAHVDFFSKT